MPYSTDPYLDFHLLSRRWLLHTGGCKMFGPLFHAGMSVLTIFFFAEYTCQMIEEELEAKKRLIEVKFMPKNDFF